MEVSDNSFQITINSAFVCVEPSSAWLVYFKYLPSNNKMWDFITRFIVSFNSVNVILTFVPFVNVPLSILARFLVLT